MAFSVRHGHCRRSGPFPSGVVAAELEVAITSSSRRRSHTTIVLVVCAVDAIVFNRVTSLAKEVATDIAVTP